MTTIGMQVVQIVARANGARKALTLALLLLVCASATAQASGGAPLRTPKGTPRATSESSYNRALALSEAGRFSAAEAAYRKTIDLNPKLAEAWNGLGHALKKQRRFEQALSAYDEALRLRPNFPLAMEYLGELYVETGQLSKARELERRLRPIDTQHADLLALAIAKGPSDW
ncbi:MAG: tetratricopeptide repeat protein [bacterium]